jgi:hypothetical protein
MSCISSEVAAKATHKKIGSTPNEKFLIESFRGKPDKVFPSRLAAVSRVGSGL